MPPVRGRRGKKKAASSALDQALASASLAVAGKKTRRHNVWEADAARPGGKTSMDVLIAWLQAEGNYVRWSSRSAAAAVNSSQKTNGTPSPHGKRGGKTRANLIREILAAFEAEGIHRTMQDVRNRMMRIEKEFEAARKWLRETGFLLAFERGVADKDVERSVLRLCKYYRELAPRFKEVEVGKPAVTIDLDNTTDDNEDAGAYGGREGSGGVSPAIDSDVGMDDEQEQQEENEQEEHEHEGQEMMVEGSDNYEDEGASTAEHEDHEDASDASRSTSRGGDDHEDEGEEAEEAAAASSSTSNPADNEEEGEEEEEEEQEQQHYEQAEESEEAEEQEERRPRRGSGGSFKRDFAAHSSKPKRRRLSLRSRGDSDEYQGDSSGDASDDDKARHRAVLLASAEEQRDQQRELFELERAKLQRELELKEIQVAYEKALARKKLLDAGVLPDEVDRILPL